MNITEDALKNIVEDVIAKLNISGGSSAPSSDCSCNGSSSSAGKYGQFEDAIAATEAAHEAYKQLQTKGVEGRAKVVEIVKTLCEKNADAWGAFEYEETKIGRPEHKPEKLKIVKLVPGTEWFRPYALSGDHGITLEEYAPFGVIGAILPVTHSVPTLSGNIVNMVAAGNSVVFNPHPGGARSAAMAVKAFNEAIHHEIGIDNLICTIVSPSLDSFNALCKAPLVNLLTITGGPGVVNAAMQSGKRAICAGPGNPPVVVDETADIDKAAQAIIAGAAFDNNLLCIGEKVVFVVNGVYQKLMGALNKHGAHRLTDNQLAKLTSVAFTESKDAGGCSHPVLNRDLVGASPLKLAQEAGAQISDSCELLIAETEAEHAFVMEEQMMPMLPIVRVNNFEEAIHYAKLAEHGYKHSSVIHSTDVSRMTAMARELETTIFIKNGACTSGLGLGGEGYLSYSIATTTGEGITNPQTFTRVRRCVMVDNLRIH